jgi:hypothetical protein
MTISSADYALLVPHACLLKTKDRKSALALGTS